MPSDAKFGLVVGMIVVLLIALLFFRKEGTGELPAAPPAPMQTPKAPEPPKVEAPPPPKVEIPPLPDDVPQLPPPAFEPLPVPSITKMGLGLSGSHSCIHSRL